MILYQDIEQGSRGKRATEEVIEILVTSFKSSDGYQEVKRQVSEIRKQVSKQIPLKPIFAVGNSI